MAVELATGYISLVPSARGIGTRISRELAPVSAIARRTGEDAGKAMGDNTARGFSSTFSSKLKSFGAVAAGSLGLALGAATVAAGTFGLKAAADFQQARISFDSLLGSAEKGGAFLKQLTDFAARTPFELPGLQNAARTLLGVGFSAEQVIPTLTQIGNVAASLGVSSEGIDGVVRALGQMKGKGKASAEELQQISEQIPGFSAIGAIAKSMGISTEEAFDQISKGAISADDAIAAILQGMEEFPGAAGAMEKQAQTLSGVLSTLKDTLKLSLAQGFQPILPALTGALQGAVPAIQTALAGISSAVGGLATNLLGPITDALAKLAPAIGPVLSSIAGAIGGVITALGPTFGAIGDVLKDLAPTFKVIGQALKPVASAFGRLLQAVLPLIPPLARLFGQIFGASAKVAATVLGALADAAKPLVAALKPLGPVLGEVAETLGRALGDAIQEIAPVLPELTKALGEVAAIIAKDLAGALKALAPALPALAQLVTIGAELIAKIPPEVLAKIVEAFLAFKLIKGVGGGISDLLTSVGKIGDAAFTAGQKLVGLFTAQGAGELATKMTPVSDAIATIATKAREAFTALTDLFKKAAQRVLVKVEASVVAGAAEGATDQTSKGILAGIATRLGLGPAKGPFLGTLAMSIGVLVTAEIVLEKITGLDPFGFGEFRSEVRDLFKGEKFDLGSLVNFDKNPLLQAGKGIVDGLLQGIGDAFSSAGEALRRIFYDGIVNTFKGALGIASPSTVMIELGTNVIEGLLQGITTAFTTVVEFFTTIPSLLLTAVGDLAGLAVAGAQIVASFIGGIISGIPNLLLTVATLPGQILGAVGPLVGTFIGKGVELMTGFALGIVQVVPQILQFFVGLPGAILGWIGPVVTTLFQKGLDLLIGLGQGILVGGAQVLAFFIGLPQRIIDLIPNPLTALLQVGRDLIQGLLDGINDVKDRVFGVVESIVDKIKDLPGISWLTHSPSRLYAQYGRDLMKGLELGIKAGAPAALNAASITVDQFAALNPTMSGTTAFVPASPDAVSAAGGSRAGVVIENMNAWNAVEAAQAITDEQTWAELTGRIG